MAHLHSKVDLMHVPTPLDVVARIRGLLSIPSGVAALDPCCGTGAALQALLGAETAKVGGYGIELEQERAKEARWRLKQTLACAMQESRVSNDAFGLLFLNPPYDDSTEGRLEKVFLDRCTRWLRPGGMLVFIIPVTRYVETESFIRRHYDVIGHWRFPDPHFNGPEHAFKQTVLLATRRAFPAFDRHPEDFWRDSLLLNRETATIGDRLAPLPEVGSLPNELPHKVMAGEAGGPRLFVSSMLSMEELESMLASSPLSKPGPGGRGMRMPSALGCGRPPLILKQGHLALTLASGLVNGCYGVGAARHVAKGTVVREIARSHEIDETSDGKAVVIHHETDSFAVKIRALTADGTIHDMVGASAAPEPEAEEKEAA